MTQTAERETWTCTHCHETVDVTDYVKWLRQWGPNAYGYVPEPHYRAWKILVLCGVGNPNEWDGQREYAHTTITFGLKAFQAFNPTK